MAKKLYNTRYMLGTLYIVATPIGNLEDISLRALRTLKEVDLILAEDTRVTSKLLRHYDIPTRFYFSPSGSSRKRLKGRSNVGRNTRILSYHHHTSDSKKLRILKELIDGKNIALVTDAGTPGVSDPGNELIDYFLDKEPEICVIPIPGASAIATALSISGMNVNRFVFAGFLPKRSLNKFLDQISLPGLPIVFFTSPKRLIKNLDLLVEKYGGDREIVIARELTKLHETIYRGAIEEVRGQLLERSNIKGEVVVIVGS